MMKESFMLFLPLAIVYIVCLVAKKETGALKTLGYTLGAAIFIVTLFYGYLTHDQSYPPGSELRMKCGQMAKERAQLLKEARRNMAKR